MNVASQWQDNLKYAEIPMLNTYCITFFYSLNGEGKSILKLPYFNRVVNPQALLGEINFGMPLTNITESNDEYFTGVLKLYNPENVYSVGLYKSLSPGGRFGVSTFNITNLKSFLEQFKNLKVFSIDAYSYNVNNNSPIIKGDLGDLPNGIEKIYISDTDVRDNESLIYNIDSHSNYSKLEKIKRMQVTTYAVSKNYITTTGDLYNLPPLIKYFDWEGVKSSTSNIYYSGGKTWVKDFEKFRLNYTIDTESIDMLLIDFNNSIENAIGEKIIYLKGTRSSLSDNAVTGLENKGFTVTIVQ